MFYAKSKKSSKPGIFGKLLSSLGFSKKSKQASPPQEECRMSYQRDERDNYAMDECCVPESIQMCAMKDDDYEEEHISYKMA